MRRRSFKRTLLTVLLLLSGGAIINVAVAWGCAKWVFSQSDSGSLWFGHVPLKAPVWYCIGWELIGATRVLSRPIDEQEPDFHMRMYGGKLTLPYWSRTSATTLTSLDDQPRFMVEDARGWPFRSMLCIFQRSTFIDSPSVETELRYGIALPNGVAGVIAGDEHRALPLKPIWPGFAINTVFYGATLWLLFAAPGFIRRRIRIKRDLCPACAYPVGASAVCTECGAVLPLPSGRGLG